MVVELSEGDWIVRCSLIENAFIEKAEAEELANEILGRALAGEDFDELVKEYTNDSHPGIYTMANQGQPKPPGGFMRDNMAIRFGDVSFSLEVGASGWPTTTAPRAPTAGTSSSDWSSS